MGFESRMKNLSRKRESAWFSHRVRMLTRKMARSPLRNAWRKLPVGLRKKIRPVGGLDGEVPRVFPTIACNLACEYCTIEIALREPTPDRPLRPINHKYPLLPEEDWIAIINDLPGDAVIINGGEPMLHPKLPEIINEIKQTDVSIYTNLSHKVESFMNRLEKPVTLWSSFHPCNDKVAIETFIKTYQWVKAHSMCATIACHLVRDDLNGTEDDFRSFQAAFSAIGDQLATDDDMFESSDWGVVASAFAAKEIVQCTMNRLIIGPDGKRHFCISKMLRNTSDSHIPMDTQRPTMICDEFGCCTPCDDVAQIEFLEKKEPQLAGTP